MTVFARSFTMLSLSLAASLVMVVPALALDPSLDADGDEYSDAIELNLGSDENDAAKTPETIGIPSSCHNNVDEDLDTLVDDADSGCDIPSISDETFPSAGTDIYEVSLTLDDYMLALPTPEYPPGSACPIDFVGFGPIVVQRGNPSGGPATINTQILAMELRSADGTLTIGSDINCPLPPGPLENVTLVLDPNQISSGTITDNNASPTLDFPATSSFDLYFLFDTQDIGILPGGPQNGPVGGPLQLEGEIGSIPPYQTPDIPELTPDCLDDDGEEVFFCALPAATELDHFRSYKIVKHPKEQRKFVTVDNEFGKISSITATKPERLMIPAKVTPPGEDIHNPDARLKCYHITSGVFRQRTIDITNMFGDQRLSVGRPKTLCARGSKPPAVPDPGLNSYICYQAKTFDFKQTARDVQDEVGTFDDLAVLKLLSFCVPTGIAGEEIPDPTAYLTCYLNDPRNVKADLGVRDRFVSETVSIRNNPPGQLCVKTKKVQHSAVQDPDRNFFGVFAGTDGEEEDIGAEFDPCAFDASLRVWQGWAANRTTVLSEADTVNTPNGRRPCDQNGRAQGNGDPDTDFGTPDGQATEVAFRGAIAALKPGGTAANKPSTGDQLVVLISGHGEDGEFALDATGNTARTDGDMTAKELRDLLSGFPRGVVITVIFSACEGGFLDELMKIKDVDGKGKNPGEVEVLQSSRDGSDSAGAATVGSWHTIAASACLSDNGGKTLADRFFGNSDSVTWSIEHHLCVAPVTTLIAGYCNVTEVGTNPPRTVADASFGIGNARGNGFTASDELARCGAQSWVNGKNGVTALLAKASTFDFKQLPVFKELGNPDVDLTNSDVDGDGIPNVFETMSPERVTNPWKKDTDADGLDDETDIDRPCDPVDPDADGDQTVDSDDNTCVP